MDPPDKRTLEGLDGDEELLRFLRRSDDYFHARKKEWREDIERRQAEIDGRRQEIRAQEKFLRESIRRARLSVDEAYLSRCYQTAAEIGLDHILPDEFVRGSSPAMTDSEIVRMALARG